MTRKIIFFCLVLTLSLTGCRSQSSPTQKALDFRTALLEAGGCSFTAVIGADYGDRLYSFSVSCDYTTDGMAEITVLQPEEIAGIAATVSENGAVIEFQDVELDFGVMANGVVSPVQACQVLGRCWSSSYIASAGADGELERITYLDGYEDEELTVDTWLDAAGTPVYSEIAYGSVRCLTLQLTDFQFEEDL